MVSGTNRATGRMSEGVAQLSCSIVELFFEFRQLEKGILKEQSNSQCYSVPIPHPDL